MSTPETPTPMIIEKTIPSLPSESQFDIGLQKQDDDTPTTEHPISYITLDIPSDELEEDEEEEEGHLDQTDLGLGSKLQNSQLCTYTSTKNNFAEQHWYYCYTCGLTMSEGCCSVCVKNCHTVR